MAVTIQNTYLINLLYFASIIEKETKKKDLNFVKHFDYKTQKENIEEYSLFQEQPELVYYFIK